MKMKSQCGRHPEAPSHSFSPFHAPMEYLVKKKAAKYMCSILDIEVPKLEHYDAPSWEELSLPSNQGQGDGEGSDAAARNKERGVCVCVSMYLCKSVCVCVCTYTTR